MKVAGQSLGSHAVTAWLDLDGSIAIGERPAVDCLVWGWAPLPDVEVWQDALSPAGLQQAPSHDSPLFLVRTVRLAPLVFSTLSQTSSPSSASVHAHSPAWITCLEYGGRRA